LKVTATLETFLNYIPRKIATYQLWKECVAYSFNFRIKTETRLMVAGVHIHCSGGDVQETVQDRVRVDSRPLIGSPNSLSTSAISGDFE